MKIKVLLVDDHLLVLLGIKQLLEHESDLEVVNTICDPAGINAAISKNHPDVVVMDIRMKGYNGIELTKKLIESYPNLKIVILSAYNDDEYIDASYHAGAYAFITKENSAAELANAIRQSFLGNNIIPRKKIEYQNHYLTKTELEILKLISEDKTNAEISDILMVSRRTVEHHVSSIIKKLNVYSRVGAVVKGIKLGLLKTI
ncbi:response regulator transcription factor [Aeribacillus sp. FSL K6-1121]|uniref:response regulator transcription factor n=1 Tax=unclassified Aeribacillus TaxID=2640495 RepID=UPI0030CB11E2